MSDFAGWFYNDATSNLDHVELMTGKNAGSFHSSNNIVSNDKSLLLNVPKQDGNSEIFFSDDCGCLISGEAYWEEGKYSKLSEEQGFPLSLVYAYKELGKKILDILHGPFAIAILDSRNRKILLAIDRMGIKSLAYNINGRDIVFSTRTGFVACHPQVKTEISNHAIYDYLYFHMVPGPESIYKGVRKLGPAEYIEIANGSVNQGRYWNPEFGESDKSEARLCGELRDILGNSVERCLAKKTGTFLSGGLDSSTVTGIAGTKKGGNVDAFSIGFNADGYDEMPYARLAAGHFNVRHHEYYLSHEDVVDAIPRIVNAYDEPFGNSSAVPTYLCAKKAKEHGVDVMLAGDGGDELFAGNERYIKQNIFEYYNQVPLFIRAVFLEPLILKTGVFGKIKGLSKIKSYIEQAKIPLPDRLETYNYFHINSPKNVLNPDFITSIDLDSPIKSIRDTYFSTNSNDRVNRMLFLDWKKTLADNDLRKVNTMSELAGIRTVYPMLDDEVVSFSTTIPTEMKLKGNKLRAFYKKAFGDFLPQEIINKRKHGFGLPYGVWMKDYAPLKELAYDSMESLKKRHYFQESYIDKLVRSHDKVHPAYFGEFIWVFMMLELWLQSHNI